MKHWRHKQTVLYRETLVFLKVSPGLGSVLVPYLSLDPVEEIFLDFAERLRKLQDGLVWIFTVGDLTDVNHLTGAALHNTKQSHQAQTPHVWLKKYHKSSRKKEKRGSPGWSGSSWSDWLSPVDRTPSPWRYRCKTWPSLELLLLLQTEGTPEHETNTFTDQTNTSAFSPSPVFTFKYINVLPTCDSHVWLNRVSFTTETRPQTFLEQLDSTCNINIKNNCFYRISWTDFLWFKVLKKCLKAVLRRRSRHGGLFSCFLPTTHVMDTFITDLSHKCQTVPSLYLNRR